MPGISLQMRGSPFRDLTGSSASPSSSRKRRWALRMQWRAPREALGESTVVTVACTGRKPPWHARQLQVHRTIASFWGVPMVACRVMVTLAGESGYMFAEAAVTARDVSPPQ